MYGLVRREEGKRITRMMSVWVVVLSKHCTVDYVAGCDGADEEINEIKWKNECKTMYMLLVLILAKSIELFCQEQQHNTS